MIWFLIALTVVVAVGGYILWVRPVLEQNPRFQEISKWETDFWDRVSIRFAGIRQKLTTRLVVVAGITVTVYDFGIQVLNASGFDLTTYEPLTAYVPSSAWPILTVGVTALVQYFRNLNDKAVSDDPPEAG